MNMIKPFFPFSFDHVKAKDANSLIVSVIIYIVAMLASGLVNLLLGWIPVLGFLLGVIGWVLGIYCVAGLVLSVLLYLDVLK